MAQLVTGLFTGWGAILVSVLMAFTVLLNWPRRLNYVWAGLVLISGLLSL